MSALDPVILNGVSNVAKAVAELAGRPQQAMTAVGAITPIPSTAPTLQAGEMEYIRSGVLVDDRDYPDFPSWLPRYAGETWVNSSSLPSASPLWSAVAYGNGVFVAVSGGESGNNSVTAATSVDGKTWVARTLPVAAKWTAVCFGDGVFVAIARDGQIATSSDGVTWTLRTPPVNTTLCAIAYGNGRFVAVAGGKGPSAVSIVLVSVDGGVTWTNRSMPTTQYWGSIAYGNGVFVAVAGLTSAASAVATSIDGITWTQSNMPLTTTWVALAFGAGVFVAAHAGGFVVSTDGKSWISTSLPSGTSSISVGALVYVNGTFVSVPKSAGANAVFVSQDGYMWDSTPSASVAGNGCATSETLVVAVSSDRNTSVSPANLIGIKTYTKYDYLRVK
ncbi:TPA: hypothetical protein ACSP31_000805 [Aeromonas veronii]